MDRLLLTVLAIGGLTLTAAKATADRTWSVKQGDTLTAIALRFSVTVSDTMKRNGLTSDQLRVGQELKIGPPSGPELTEVEGDKESAAPAGPHYTVKRGDTLSGIADKLGIPLSDLLTWNAELSPDRIREGQRLRLAGGGNRIRYKVLSGDTLIGIAQHHQISLADLSRWNPRLASRGLRAGDTLTLFSNVPKSSSESIGTPSRGKLKNARPLRPHRAYRIRDRSRAWGTAEAVHHVRKAFDGVLARFPATPKVEVHDLSHKHGGPMTHHRSHQSGRDVDIAYFRRGCRPRGCGFRPAGGTLDVARQWTLLEHWLRHNLTEAIFIDYNLQAALYRHARKRGASSEELRLWFQYPRGRTFPLGVIRHFPKHADHMHVRFACHRSDKDCKTFRPLLMQQQHASR